MTARSKIDQLAQQFMGPQPNRAKAKPADVWRIEQEIACREVLGVRASLLEVMPASTTLFVRDRTGASQAINVASETWRELRRNLPRAYTVREVLRDAAIELVGVEC